MTNEVPDIIVDLPTYDQVEDVKNVVVNTGGMIVDTSNKKYKAEMHTFSTKGYYGEDVMKKLNDDFVNKYPTIAKRMGNMISPYKRTHLFDDIHFVMNTAGGIDIIFVDMKNLTVISASSILHADYQYAVPMHASHFIDSKYIYLRGKPNTNNTISFAVFDKTTYQFVTAIKSNTTLSVQDQVIPGEFVLQGNKLFFASSQYNNIIFIFNLTYNSTGVPNGLIFEAQATFGSGGANPPKIFFGDSEYVYIGYENSTNMLTLDKKKYNRVGTNFENIATNTTSNSYARGQCTWINRYSIDGVRYVIGLFGTYGMFTINVDTLSTHQLFMGSPRGSEPVFDYINNNYLASKTQTTLFTEFGENAFELYYELRLVGDLWVYDSNFAITSKIFTKTATGYDVSPSEMLYLDYKSTILNGVLYGYKHGSFAGVSSGTFRMEDIAVLSHYKEVK